jgi:hypothetical protein
MQMVKQRRNGRVIGTKLRVIYGDEKDVIALLGQSTAYIERSNLTSRTFNSRLVRKTLAFSKLLEMYVASCAWEDVIYNLGRSHKSLKLEVFNEERRWQRRSPAMVAGLADHIWSIEEILTTVVAPNT